MKFLKTIFIPVLCFIITNSLFGQTYKVFGKITDTKSNKPLEYVTVKLVDSTYGTAADKNGNYFLKLSPGAHKISFSMIGYYSDTINVFLENEEIQRDVFLEPSEIMTETIVVLGEDPAYEIIRKAIKYKKEFRSMLNEYDYDSYTKYVFRSNLSELKKDSLTEKDKYPIFAILESETKGYFRKPDEYKEIVRSKRETANILKGIATPYIVNFYDEMIDFGEVKITGPLADDAEDYYQYRLDKVTSIDSQRVFKIKVLDGSGFFPLFKGDIYIADSTFALLKVDLSNNDAALPFAVDALNFKQKFTTYYDERGNKFWMPTDVQLYAEISVAGLFALQGEGFTIVSHYSLNKKAPKGTFDEYVIKVLPDAKKDSTYWKDNQLVKSSKEESVAYKEIDKKTKANKGKIRFGLTSIDFGEYVSTNPLSYYTFNRVEGSRLEFNLNLRSPNRKSEFEGYIGYGFSDKKTKYGLSYSGRFLRANSLRVNAGVFSNLRTIGYKAGGLSLAFNTFGALLWKRDYFDYYYSNGWNASVSKLLTPQFGLTLKYNQEKQKTADKNTDYSFYKKDEPYNSNPQINDAFLRTAGIGLTIDPNTYKYIDFGDGDESRFRETDYPKLTLGYEITPVSFGSTYEYRKYTAELTGINSFGRFINLDYRLGAVYMNGNVPFQSLGYFVSSPVVEVGKYSFRTLKFREFLGDKVYFANIENNFSNIMFSFIKPIRKWEFIGFGNFGKTEITNSNFDLAASKNFTVTGGWLIEAGFGIGNIFNLLRVDFAWRLTERSPGSSNFNVTISSVFR